MQAEHPRRCVSFEASIAVAIRFKTHQIQTPFRHTHFSDLHSSQIMAMSITYDRVELVIGGNAKKCNATAASFGGLICFKQTHCRCTTFGLQCRQLFCDQLEACASMSEEQLATRKAAPHCHLPWPSPDSDPNHPGRRCASEGRSD